MSDIEQLARWRTIGARHSEEVVEIAQKVLKGSVGEQEWAIREQLAIAALDLGQNKLATDQINILHRKFPASPRVKILDGLLLEARDDLPGAQKVYETLLAIDETNVSAHQRMIALSLSSPTTPTSVAITNLLTYLDIFYSDPSAWSLLAELYCEQGMYPQALGALGHLMSVQSWDEGVVRRAGEVAYTLGDYQLALKHLLRAAEMEGGKTSNPKPSRTRTWWSIKLTVGRLLDPNTPSGSGSNIETSIPEDMRSTTRQLQALDQLATERILAAESSATTTTASSAALQKGNMDVVRAVLGEGKLVR
ncbi:hypothetical protein IAT40_002966 [Kwoniella sp. CBS 6097]